MIAVIAPPDMPERQLQAAQTLAQRAYEYRTSYRGIDHAKRRDAALRGRGRG